MDSLSQIVRLLFRNKYLLIFLPLIAALIAVYQTRNMNKEYTVNTTIYTGIASGFTIESEGGRIDWSSVNNGMDNIITIIKSKITLRNVAIRLYAQHMIHGNPQTDNNWIQAKNYRALLMITPKEVLALIDKTSEEQTIENLNAYEKASPKNFVYGLFNWYHHHYSFNALSKIQVRRISDSDMLEIEFTSDDPGIAYNTLVILNEEFAKQYKILRFGETNDVIDYFNSELTRIKTKLRRSEDSLTQYFVTKKIIDYNEQAKNVADLTKEYELMYYEVVLRVTSTSATVNELEKKIIEQKKLIENNNVFINRIENISRLSSEIQKRELFRTDSSRKEAESIGILKSKLSSEEAELKEFTAKLLAEKYTKEGIATMSFVEKWINELIEREKATSQLDVMNEIRGSLDEQYIYLSPIGSTIKRKEREIGFDERQYLEILQSLNAALLRQKTIQMSSATLKAINPPLFPLYPKPTGRMAIVLTTLFGTFAFIIAYLVLLEIFDRTVRDKERAERLTSTKVLGVFPRRNRFRYSMYSREYERIAINYLANSIIPYLNPKEKPDIINFISTDSGTGKSMLIDFLYEYWTERGLRVRVLSWHEAISSDSRDYLLSMNISELYDYENEDIILVEHRSILQSAIPVGLLREASINIAVIRGDKVWQDVDKIAFDRLKDNAKETPVLLYLTQVKRNPTENILGMLPPFTPVRRFVYKMIQFGFTSK